jgi:hypothetical protein
MICPPDPPANPAYRQAGGRQAAGRPKGEKWKEAWEKQCYSVKTLWLKKLNYEN